MRSSQGRGSRGERRCGQPEIPGQSADDHPKTKVQVFNAGRARRHLFEQQDFPADLAHHSATCHDADERPEGMTYRHSDTGEQRTATNHTC